MDFEHQNRERLSTRLLEVANMGSIDYHNDYHRADSFFTNNSFESRDGAL